MNEKAFTEEEQIYQRMMTEMVVTDEEMEELRKEVLENPAFDDTKKWLESRGVDLTKELETE